MLMLVLIGLLGAASIAISPRVPPVESPGPVTTTTKVVSSADGGAIVVAVPDTPAPPKRSHRPYAVGAGLVVVFGVCTLLGSVLVNPLGVPDGVPRVIGFALLVLIGFGLLVARPPARLVYPFVLAVGLGLLCAGHPLGLSTAALAIGAAVALPLCALADRWPAARTHASTVRRVGGVVVLALAVAVAFG